MSSNEYCVGCIGVSVISSAVIGIIAAILRYTAAITVTSSFLWVVFGIAVGYLGLMLLSPEKSSTGSCACKSLSAFLVGILGTVLLSVILLGISFAATSVLGAVFTGALLFFFAFTVINATCLIKCSYNC